MRTVTVSPGMVNGVKMTHLTINVKMTGAKVTYRIGNGEVTLHHCPGHSPGSVVCTAVISDQLVLFGQDVHGPLDPMLLSNRDDYLRSLEFMQGLNADILCEGHFGIYRGKKAVRRFIGSYLNTA